MFLKTVLILRIFTSHYVSINSIFTLTKVRPPMAFTSHYVSINSEQSQDALFTSKIFTSHYVSINSSDTEPSNAFQLIFTSHYVSINSIQQPQSVGQLLQDLHPTMYLLILFLFTIHCYIQLHLHPTMYLLILTLQRQGIQVSVFTSHYVSINSVCLLKLYYLLL